MYLTICHIALYYLKLRMFHNIWSGPNYLFSACYLLMEPVVGAIGVFLLMGILSISATVISIDFIHWYLISRRRIMRAPLNIIKYFLLSVAASHKWHDLTWWSSNLESSISDSHCMLDITIYRTWCLWR